MAERDEIDEQTERLLPCSCEDFSSQGRGLHRGSCATFRRPAVATALREATKREAELKEESKKYFDDAVYHRVKVEEQKDEIADLRREVERLKAPWLCDCHTWPGPDEAHAYIVALEKRLKDQSEMNKTLWAALTPAKRYELNLAEVEKVKHED